MRAFVRLRDILGAHKELARKLEDLERHLKDHDEQIQTIFEAIRQLMTPAVTQRKKIGFLVEERPATYGKGKKKKRI